MFQIPPLTEEEFQALAGLLNAGVSAVGLRSHEPPAASAIAKIMNTEAVEAEPEEAADGDV